MASEIKTDRVKRFREIDIYPVISSEFTNGRPVLDILRQVADGGAKIVQAREKNLSKRDFYALAREYREITERYGMLLIVNDHLDIALAVGADGVHLGQDDLPLFAARPLAPELLIGISSHDMSEALAAERAGADYVNLGPLYPTQTKTLPMPPLGDAIVREGAARLKIPFTVMGGVKEEHLSGLLALGARRVAMVTEITRADAVADRVRALRRYFA